MRMGWDSSLSQSGKRGRDPEDAVYLDNFHTHKRYLSEVMASSLNGLTVGDSLSEEHRTSPSRFDPMESPVRSESIGFPREDLTSPFSPMSEDSDDSRYCDLIHQQDMCTGTRNTVSPHRHHIGGPHITYSSMPLSNSPSSPCSTLLQMAYSHSRPRTPESESRFPPSPSDICQSPNLRRAALLRSVQMRTQPTNSHAFEMPFESISDQHVDDREGSPCSYVKVIADERGYPIESRGPVRSSSRVRSMLLEDCSTMGISETQEKREKCYRALNLKGDGGGNNRGVESKEEFLGGNGVNRPELLSGRRSVLGEHAKACSFE
ncbi:hypothetical protein AMTRI_Chr02g221400 [Amborella trichopoda]